MLTAVFANLSLKVSSCCRASKVVGTKTTTCLPELTAINAALIATSVLPKPTSPQINLSIGLLDDMSVMTFLIASS